VWLEDKEEKKMHTTLVPRWLTVILIAGLGLAVVSCTKGALLQTSPGEDSALLPKFPMAPGTTWVYAYTPYQPRPSDPTQIVTATYRMTETVVVTETNPPYLFVKIQRETSLASAIPLTSTTLPGDAFGYVISGTKVYQENRAVDPLTFDPDHAHLAYIFPLEDGKQWCPIRFDLKNPADPTDVHCEANGLKTVTALDAYQTPAGRFTDCYEITEAYLSGGVTRWFCNGVGVVATKYDHGGTRFGFEKTLIDYSLSSP
jgi:hypothetical protein